MSDERALPVLAEADEWIVVAKPPRLIVHRNEHHRRADACLQRVRDQVRGRVYPIHRLDFQASGCLIFAKKRTWAGPMQESLRAGEKTYLAFVRGYYKHDEPIRIDKPMKDDNGYLKDAASVVEYIGRSQEPRCSLLRVRPETGRFHQVRRHVRDLHHPCIGDSDHGDTKVNRWWRENTSAKRLGLHCFRIELTLPNDEKLSVTCPLFEDQHSLFQTLPWWHDAVEHEPELLLDPLPMPKVEDPEENELTPPSA